MQAAHLLKERGYDVSADSLVPELGNDLNTGKESRSGFRTTRNRPTRTAPNRMM